MAWTCSGSSQAELVQHLWNQNLITSKTIYDVMSKVDRNDYLVDTSAASAYRDAPIGIACGQTMSAPHMHAMALELVADRLSTCTKVLDVGSGSGYLSTCFAYLTGPRGKIFGIDIFPNLIQTSIQSVTDTAPDLLTSGRVTFSGIVREF